ncbi:molybdate transport system regulatory protein [Povalibacter uvarum]|uniref:Molybdate transport system regulatory protein n=1 Tax=Povalibacter uvarum TaxID=732238 RepID=A0A841HH98_9GAMM|nr:LysR family transcriptional regulator [Povalibacter uvarum]MBB6092146.1 molybdate transport system regulatory protein [Povalibacter uvarum]
MSKLRVTLRVDFDRNNAIGPGKIALLEKMREYGSLSQAAKALDMSYRRAWQLLNSLNQSFREPLVVTAIGGSGGGGSTLTALGESMIATYRDFEEAMNARADKQFGPFLKNVSGGAANARRPVSRSQQGTARKSRRH